MQMADVRQNERELNGYCSHGGLSACVTRLH